jgi:hypothetical protein
MMIRIEKLMPNHTQYLKMFMYVCKYVIGTYIFDAEDLHIIQENY